MFRLETLGGLALAHGAAAGVTTQRRRLALLALLAVAGEHGLTRDKLVAYLWPETRSDNARHALEQLLYALRRQLGESLFLGPDPLRLNPEILTADVILFGHALAQGRPADAVELYRGPFLDGFYLADAPEFERWVEEERARVAGKYSWALEGLAKEAQEQGRHAEEVGWCRKIVALDPLDGKASLALMRALVAAGDPSGALQYARTYETLVREELDSGPGTPIMAFVQEIRAAQQFVPATPPPRTVAGNSVSLPQPVLATDSRRHATVGVGIALGLIVPVALALVLAHHQGAVTTRARALDPDLLVIAPFRVNGPDTSLRYLREGMVDLLATKLMAAGGPVAVDPRTAMSAWRRLAPPVREIEAEGAARVARSLGAGQVLLGEVVGTGGPRLVLNGTVFSASDARAGASASVSGPVDSLTWLIDRLAVELLALRTGEGEQRVSGLTSTSLPALHAYLDGRSAYRRGENTKAIGHYARALELDSTFGLAGLELVSALDWELHWSTHGSVLGIPFGRTSGATGWGAAWRRGMATAWGERHRLSPRDRTYLVALLGSHYPDQSSARERLADWERATQATPDRAEAWYRLGQVLLYQGQSIGLAEWADRTRAAYLRALSLDSTFAQPLAGLLELAAREGDTAEARRWAQRYLTRDSLGPTAEYVRWHIAALTGDSAALREVRRRLGSLETETLDRIQWTSQVEGIAPEDADSAMAMILGRSAGAEERASALLSRTMLRLNEGRPREAMRLWNRIDDYLPGVYIHRGLMYAMYWEGDSALGAATVQANPGAAWWTTQWRLWQGDTIGATAAIEGLRRAGPARSGPPFPAQATYLDAMLAMVMHRADAPARLRDADSVALLGCCSQPHHGDLIVARLHEMAGDLPGALAAARRQKAWYPPEYLSTALREEGRLAALVGDTAAAVRAWRHYVALRSHAEPERQAEVDQVRDQLGRLERSR